MTAPRPGDLVTHASTLMLIAGSLRPGLLIAVPIIQRRRAAHHRADALLSPDAFPPCIPLGIAPRAACNAARAIRAEKFGPVLGAIAAHALRAVQRALLAEAARQHEENAAEANSEHVQAAKANAPHWRQAARQNGKAP